MIPPVSQTLMDLLVEVYPRHVLSRLTGVEVTGLDGAVAAGQSWLASELRDLLDRPFADQRRGPLEVFQEAMRFPTERLVGAGLVPRRRDPMAMTALPGDRYDLAPASSRDLGDEVWEAHLAWGAAKAEALRRGREGDAGGS